jgi:EAL domain-containing protein (putative c-di-GMP-specific phosphodiesterase class I)
MYSSLNYKSVDNSILKNDDSFFNFNNFTITTHFQPIFSLSHKKIIGHEALMRGTCFNKQVSPLEIINSVKDDYSSTLALDRLAISTHLKNFTNQSKDKNSWLFLNMDAEVFSKTSHNDLDLFFNKILLETNLNPNQIIIEILEQKVTDDSSFVDVSNMLKEKGFLIAIDDFGAGHSNFDRIWSIMPNIVKLDRSLILKAATDVNVQRIIPRITSLLHESGALVLMEGIENINEAQIALDSDIDFVQGFFFGRPNKNLMESGTKYENIDKVWENFQCRTKHELLEYKNKISPYYNAIGYAASLLSSGRSIQESCFSFLSLSLTNFCYLLDENGTQIGVNVNARAKFDDPRFKPLDNSSHAIWSRRSYFQKAIQSFNKVQVTRPYLSIQNSELCRTISCSFKMNNKIYVICGDIISD